MHEPIIVKEMTVRVVTDDAKDPYGQQGFSAIFVEIQTSDGSLIKRLSSARAARSTITLRCAMLDAIGPITNAVGERTNTRFILAVEDLCYRKPKQLGKK